MHAICGLASRSVPSKTEDPDIAWISFIEVHHERVLRHLRHLRHSH